MLQRTAWFFLPGASPAARALAAVDWLHHPLGPPQQWPVALQLSLATMLRARTPGIVCWGEALYMFANDAALARPDNAMELPAAGAPARSVMPHAFVGREELAAGGIDACDWLGLEAAVAMGGLGFDDGNMATGWSPVFDADGQVRGGLVTGAAANVAGAAPGDVGLVLERMTDSFFMVDAHWRIVACNEQHVRITKMSRQEQIGADFRQLFLTDDTPQNARYRDMYTQVMQKQRAVSFVEYYAPFDLWTELHVYPTAGHGFAGFCRDVTALHKASKQLEDEKHKFEAIFATTSAAMALLRGPELVFEHANPRYTQLIGGRATKGRKLLDVFFELRDGPYFDLLRHVLMTGEPYTAVERRVELIVRPGGKPEECYLDFVYRRVDDKQGAPYGVLICVNDVTERVRARLQLVDALRARDDLLSICSHELKTPVASMKLSTQMFKRGLQRGDARSTSPERVARMVDQSDRQLDRLTRLIDEILDFSRINGGQLRLQPAPCDLAAIVSETLERLRPQIESAGAVVTVDLGSAARGQWDTFRLEQLLTNLLTNAVKYGAGKPIHVKLSQADDQVILEVRDQGPGISEADQRRIFLPYERAVSVHNISGLGLGLYIAQQIVVAHNGSIEVESAPGEGCSFVVHLPRNGVPPPQNAQGT